MWASEEDETPLVQWMRIGHDPLLKNIIQDLPRIIASVDDTDRTENIWPRCRSAFHEEVGLIAGREQKEGTQLS